jgi:hypothetical protein
MLMDPACVISPADRASFRRCRRQWDFAARPRRNLEPLAAGPDLERAVRDTLAVYYFPGMWDWDPSITQPLVVQGLERALAGQPERLASGRRLLDRYFSWAPGLDRFSPVLVEPEYDVLVPDPAEPSSGLVTAAGAAVRYRGRIDLLAVDQYDAYWIVRHRLVTGSWRPAAAVADDTEAVTACWAWEQFYLGMTITGTVSNELRLDAAPPRRAGPGDRPGRGRRPWPRLAGLAGRLGRRPAGRLVGQHEPSGGGRSLPQHRRMYARARAPAVADRVTVQAGPGFRRIWVRRSRAEIDVAARRLAGDAAAMLAPGLAVPPSPSDENCPPCPFRGPCQAMQAGQDPGPLLRTAYRQRAPDNLTEGRLGGGAWGMGRGAAPPRFRRPPGHGDGGPPHP